VQRDGDAQLEELADLARGARAEAIGRDVGRLQSRLADGRFHVAVLGQFKRGKSSLINALVGERILPAGVTPVTAVVTLVRFGESRSARVRLREGGWLDIDPGSLADWVSEQANPGNAKGVGEVEVFAPGELLQSGLCLADTPGLGSPLPGASVATHAFVPHLDAALFVLGADPPIGEREVELIRTVSSEVAELAVVLNKADLVAPTDLAAARVFTERVLAGAAPGAKWPIFEVSAAEELAGRIGLRDWRALRGHLSRLGRERARLLDEARGRELRGLVRRLSRELDERQQVLVRPLHESEARVEVLRRCTGDVGDALRELSHRLEAEQERLSAAGEERKCAFVAAALPHAREELAARLRALGGTRAKRRRGALAAVQEICMRRVSEWRAAVTPEFEALYRGAAERLVAIARGFVARLAATEDAELVAEHGLARTETGLRAASGLFLVNLWNRTVRSPLRWLLDAMRTPAGFSRALADESETYLETLLYTNATRTENDFNARVRESRRSLEAEVRARLAELHEVAARALEQSRERLAAGDEATRAERARLEDLRRRARALAAAVA